MYLLDTNLCIRILTGRAPTAKAKLDSLLPRDVLVCSVVKAELFWGAMKSNHPSRALAQQKRFLLLFSSLPFDDLAAEEFGRIRADLARKGTPIGPYDFNDRGRRVSAWRHARHSQHE
jgi:tRNA(fMet)-specific endonuclease VapC